MQPRSCGAHISIRLNKAREGLSDALALILISYTQPRRVSDTIVICSTGLGDLSAALAAVVPISPRGSWADLNGASAFVLIATSRESGGSSGLSIPLYSAPPRVR